MRRRGFLSMLLLAPLAALGVGSCAKPKEKKAEKVSWVSGPMCWSTSNAHWFITGEPISGGRLVYLDCDGTVKGFTYTDSMGTVRQVPDPKA